MDHWKVKGGDGKEPLGFYTLLRDQIRQNQNENEGIEEGIRNFPAKTQLIKTSLTFNSIQWKIQKSRHLTDFLSTSTIQPKPK